MRLVVLLHFHVQHKQTDNFHVFNFKLTHMRRLNYRHTCSMNGW